MKGLVLRLVIGFFPVFLFIAHSAGFKTGLSIAFNHKENADQGLGFNACHNYYDGYVRQSGKPAKSRADPEMIDFSGSSMV